MVEDVALPPPTGASPRSWRARVGWLDPDTGEALHLSDGTAMLEIAPDPR
jgi:hypothetical protein